MSIAYRGSVDDHGESADWHLRDADSTFRGTYGSVCWGASLVAEHHQQIVAACVITEDDGRLLLAFALTLQEWAGRGIGAALITRSAARLRGAGSVEWTLAVTAGNPARSLYERLGFVADESLRRARSSDEN